MTTDALPNWDGMSDLDKGVALLHLHKREWEGTSYAIQEYPARYFDHPALTALDPAQACRHAAAQDAHAMALTFTEYARLYDGALDADLARIEARR